MGNYILKNNQVIMRCNNLAMDTFYEYLSDVVKKEGIEEKQLLLFLNRINQDIYGRGNVYVELMKYLPNEELLLMLHKLVGKAIKQMQEKNEYSDDRIKIFEDFYGRILT